jgi:hypothetical protein
MKKMEQLKHLFQFLIPKKRKNRQKFVRTLLFLKAAEKNQ